MEKWREEKKGISGRRKSKCKGPEARKNLVYLSSREKAGGAGR